MVGVIYVAIGDLHIVQADEELCVATTEVSGEVQVKLNLIKRIILQHLVIETLDRYVIVTLEQILIR